MATRKPNSRDRLLKVQTNVYLEPAQDAALRALAARTRIPMQVLMREGIDLVLAKHKGK
ncbi:MAG TPA: ribbon-helix-helix domain-containing protein [Candidatus Acidoferrales bacterium]|nr:ribbon-helix-helix domain-containing protein [Candidatus Acidoferrales bacterium]